MLYLIASSALLWFGSAVWVRLAADGWWTADWRNIVTMVLVLTAVPVICSWLAAEVVNLVFPRRILDRRVPRRKGPIIAGLAAGILGVALAAVLLSLLDGFTSDAVITGVSAALGMALVLLLTRRVGPRWACPHCGYDLRGITVKAGGKCPECGAGVMEPVDPTPEKPAQSTAHAANRELDVAQTVELSTTGG